jgi:hypothetical protein
MLMQLLNNKTIKINITPKDRYTQLATPSKLAVRSD